MSRLVVADVDGTLYDSGKLRLQSFQAAVADMLLEAKNAEEKTLLIKLQKNLSSAERISPKDMADLFRGKTENDQADEFIQILQDSGFKFNGLHQRGSDYKLIKEYEKSPLSPEPTECNTETLNEVEEGEVRAHRELAHKLIVRSVGHFRENVDKGKQPADFYPETFWIVANIVKQEIGGKDPDAPFTVAWSSNNRANPTFESSIRALYAMGEEAYNQLGGFDSSGRECMLSELLSFEQLGLYCNPKQKREPVYTHDKVKKSYDVSPNNTFKVMPEAIFFSKPLSGIKDSQLKGRLKGKITEELEQKGNNTHIENNTHIGELKGLDTSKIKSKSVLAFIAILKDLHILETNTPTDLIFLGDSPKYEIKATEEALKLQKEINEIVNQNNGTISLVKKSPATRAQHVIVNSGRITHQVPPNQKMPCKVLKTSKPIDTTAIVMANAALKEQGERNVQNDTFLEKCMNLAKVGTLQEGMLQPVIAGMLNKGLLIPDPENQGKYKAKGGCYRPVIFQDAECDDNTQIGYQMMQAAIILKQDPTAKVDMVLFSCGGESHSQYRKVKHLADQFFETYIFPLGATKDQFKLTVIRDDSSPDQSLVIAGQRKAEIYCQQMEATQVEQSDEERKTLLEAFMQRVKDEGGFTHLTSQSQLSPYAEGAFTRVYSTLRNNEQADQPSYIVTNSWEFNSKVPWFFDIFNQSCTTKVEEGNVTVKFPLSFATEIMPSAYHAQNQQVISVNEAGAPMVLIAGNTDPVPLSDAVVSHAFNAFLKECNAKKINASMLFYSYYPHLLLEKLKDKDPETLTQLRGGLEAWKVSERYDFLRENEELLRGNGVNFAATDELLDSLRGMMEKTTRNFEMYHNMQYDPRVIMHDKRITENLDTYGVPTQTETTRNSKGSKTLSTEGGKLQLDLTATQKKWLLALQKEPEGQLAKAINAANVIFKLSNNITTIDRVNDAFTKINDVLSGEGLDTEKLGVLQSQLSVIKTSLHKGMMPDSYDAEAMKEAFKNANNLFGEYIGLVTQKIQTHLTANATAGEALQENLNNALKGIKELTFKIKGSDVEIKQNWRFGELNSSVDNDFMTKIIIDYTTQAAAVAAAGGQAEAVEVTFGRAATGGGEVVPVIASADDGQSHACAVTVFDAIKAEMAFTLQLALEHALHKKPELFANITPDFLNKEIEIAAAAATGEHSFHEGMKEAIEGAKKGHLAESSVALEHAPQPQRGVGARAGARAGAAR